MFPVTTINQTDDSDYFLNFKYMAHKDFSIPPLEPECDLAKKNLHARDIWDWCRNYLSCITYQYFKLPVRWVKYWTQNPQSTKFSTEKKAKTPVELPETFGQ